MWGFVGALLPFSATFYFQLWPFSDIKYTQISWIQNVCILRQEIFIEGLLCSTGVAFNGTSPSVHPLSLCKNPLVISQLSNDWSASGSLQRSKSGFLSCIVYFVQNWHQHIMRAECFLAHRNYSYQCLPHFCKICNIIILYI